ncbi:MAG: hypothetical protein ACPH9T_04575 [Paracoccaceae bacterium]
MTKRNCAQFDRPADFRKPIPAKQLGGYFNRRDAAKFSQSDFKNHETRALFVIWDWGL